MKLLNKIVDGCIKVLSGIAGLALGFLLIAICFATFSRFVFNNPMSNLVEYSAYTLLYVTFFGAPGILKERAHINVDIVSNALPKQKQQILTVVVDIIGVIASAAICFYGAQVAIDNFISKIRVMDSMGTPQYLLTMAIPIGMFFMTVQFIRNLAQDWSNLKKEA